MLCLEFIGLIVFSFLMGSVATVFGAEDNFDQLIESKLEDLDKWIKKLEKSVAARLGSAHMQPALYNDVLRYVETAIQYDFNLLIEEFGFYNELPFRLQTDLI